MQVAYQPQRILSMAGPGRWRGTQVRARGVSQSWPGQGGIPVLARGYPFPGYGGTPVLSGGGQSGTLKSQVHLGKLELFISGVGV